METQAEASRKRHRLMCTTLLQGQHRDHSVVHAACRPAKSSFPSHSLCWVGRAGAGTSHDKCRLLTSAPTAAKCTPSFHSYLCTRSMRYAAETSYTGARAMVSTASWPAGSGLQHSQHASKQGVSGRWWQEPWRSHRHPTVGGGLGEGQAGWSPGPPASQGQAPHWPHPQAMGMRLQQWMHRPGRSEEHVQHPHMLHSVDDAAKNEQLVAGGCAHGRALTSADHWEGFTEERNTCIASWVRSLRMHLRTSLAWCSGVRPYATHQADSPLSGKPSNAM